MNSIELASKEFTPTPLPNILLKMFPHNYGALKNPKPIEELKKNTDKRMKCFVLSFLDSVSKTLKVLLVRYGYTYTICSTRPKLLSC